MAVVFLRGSSTPAIAKATSLDSFARSFCSLLGASSLLRLRRRVVTLATRRPGSVPPQKFDLRIRLDLQHRHRGGYAEASPLRVNFPGGVGMRPSARPLSSPPTASTSSTTHQADCASFFPAWLAAALASVAREPARNDPRRSATAPRPRTTGGRCRSPSPAPGSRVLPLLLPADPLRRSWPLAAGPPPPRRRFPSTRFAAATVVPIRCSVLIRHSRRSILVSPPPS